MPTRSAGAWRRWTRGFSLAALALGLAALAAAQEPPAPPEPPKPLALAETLPQAVWDPAERGPLLVLDPENLFPVDNVPREALLSERNPALLGEQYGLRLVRYDTLTLLAPATMATIVAPEYPNHDWRFLSRDLVIHPLLASLSPTQWDRALSEAGLAFADLADARQRALWSAALGRTLDFRAEGDASADSADNQESEPLSAAEASGLRLRLRRLLRVVASHRSNPERSILVREATPRGRRTRLIVRPDEPPPRFSLDSDPIRRLPYRRKPSDLSSEDPAFVAGVPLEGAATVGDLVARLAAATGIELYVDRRVGERKVALRTSPGATVRAADLLEALCRGLGGAVRRVRDGAAEVYLLTYDRVGLTAYSLMMMDRMLPQMLNEIGRAGERTREAARARQQVRRRGVLLRIPRQADPPWPETLWSEAEQGKAARRPLTALPPETTARVQASWERALERERARERDPEDTEPPLAPAPDALEATLAVTAEIVSAARPGVATIAYLDREDFVAPDEAPSPPVRLPARLTQRALMVRLPETTAESERLTALARAKGFTALYVPVAPTAAAEKALATLGQAAARVKVGVVPVLAALTPAPDEADALRDVSATGRSAVEMAQGRQMEGYAAGFPPFAALFEQIQSADYLVPEAVRSDAFAARAARLAALAGVVAVGIDEVAAPGYGDSARGDDGLLWDGGYTPSERLAFLRAQRIDPIDFATILSDFDLPFFRDAKIEEQTQTAWNRRRVARRDQLLKRLDAALKRAAVKAPLLTRRPAWIDPGEGHWEPWRGQWLSKRDGVGNGPRPALLHLGRIAALFASILGSDLDEALQTDTQRLQKWLTERFDAMDKDAPEPENIWDGIVLDLTDLPLSDAQTALEIMLASPVPKKRAPGVE